MSHPSKSGDPSKEASGQKDEVGFEVQTRKGSRKTKEIVVIGIVKIKRAIRGLGYHLY